MNSLVQSLAAPESVAALGPMFFFGTEWLNESGPISEILLLAAWQGALIAAVTAVVLALLRHARPVWRYATATTALVLLTALPVLTWTLAPAPSANSQPLPAPAVAPVAPTAPVFLWPEPRALPSASASASGAERAAADPSATESLSAGSFTETLRSGWSQFMETAIPDPVVSTATSVRAWGYQTAPWWAAIWLAGVAVSMVYVAGGLWWIRSVRRSAKPLPESLRSLVVSAAHQAGTRTSLSVKQSRQIDVPLVSGWLSPVVLLPSRLVEEAPEEEIEALLIHEMTHVRRHDVPVGWLQAVTEALLFFHPAAWWLSRQVRREREHGTDDQVTNAGVSPVTYAQALTRVAESVVDARPVPRVTLAPAASDGELLHRIRRMVTDTPEPVRRGSLLIATLALLAIPVLLTACSSGENAAEAPPAVSAPPSPQAPEAPKQSSGFTISRSMDNDTSRVKAFHLSTSDGDSVRVQRVRIQGDSVWLNDRLIVDSTWSAAFDSSFTYRLTFDDFAFDDSAFDDFRLDVPEIDTASINDALRGLDVDIEEMREGLRVLSNDSAMTAFGFSRGMLDSLRSTTGSLDSLMGLRLSSDSLSVHIRRGLESYNRLRSEAPFPDGSGARVVRFEMNEDDRLRIVRDSARTADEMMREAERLRREAERMERHARELQEEQDDGGGE